ncbi:hypothetical protein TWF506_009099 [Arthrobotrys conoides]|uniref:Uncharacterized protein n=1 Tax=Arthrobotrys conoides TaxID=74498 RepID=A0AAN8RXI0_9PEZI
MELAITLNAVAFLEFGILSVNWAWEQTTFVGAGGITTVSKNVPASCRPWPLASPVVTNEPATYRIPSNMNNLPVWPNLATRDLEGGGSNSYIGKTWVLLWEGICDNSQGVCTQTYWRGQDWTKTPLSTGDIANACGMEFAIMARHALIKGTGIKNWNLAWKSAY